MKILLTGASSFTGMWFAHALTRAGAHVTAPLRAKIGDYEGMRAVRVRRLAKMVEVVEGAPLGGTEFMQLVQGRGFDVFCHHAARVTDYRSPDFDPVLALADNTNNFRQVLESLRHKGLEAVIATGSVFEQDEGVGDHPLRAFSPYGLSKGLTWQVIRYWCTVLGIPCGKFVIPNPFGPFDEPKFPHYLINRWRNGQPAEVRTPAYVRDNIHVDLLARAYARFVAEILRTGQDAKYGPSGYRESQGAFTERFAREMRTRLGLACEVLLPEQTDFSEPAVRLNPHTLDLEALHWNEKRAWDDLAEYYLREAADGATAAAPSNGPGLRFSN